ncbi:MAG: DUF885 domain-containing protein [Gammaproteobacteria bacterium]
MPPDDHGFDALVENYYQAWFRYHPSRAVDAGLPGYAGQLRPYLDDDIGALIALNEKLLNGLDEFEADQLDQDRAMDLAILRGAALIEIQELRDSDWRHHNPLEFLPLRTLHQLTLRPVQHRGRALKQCLTAIPEYLRGARAELALTPELIPILWLETAWQEALTGADFVRELHQAPMVYRSITNLDELRPLQEAAAHALIDFAHFLEHDIGPSSEGDLACGRRHFERLLKLRHFLDVDLEQLHGLGTRLAADATAQLEAACRELGATDVAAALARLEPAGTDDTDTLAVYQRTLQLAREFLIQHDLVSLPARESLQVVGTPLFLHDQIPFAAYYEPSPGDLDQHGVFFVTPPEEGETNFEHSPTVIRHTCVHEAWPGHHLQFVTANLRYTSRSLPRLLNPSATLYEGWALYSERLMHEQGFLNGPESRLILARDYLWRALRILIDVELHTGGLGVDVAAERLQESLGFDYHHARGELTWYSLAPTQPMSYATGQAMILSARKHPLGAGTLGLKQFHDRLLACGSIALPLVLRRQFGESLCQDVRREVFQS